MDLYKGNLGSHIRDQRNALVLQLFLAGVIINLLFPTYRHRWAGMFILLLAMFFPKFFHVMDESLCRILRLDVFVAFLKRITLSIVNNHRSLVLTGCLLVWTGCYIYFIPYVTILSAAVYFQSVVTMLILCLLVKKEKQWATLCVFTLGLLWTVLLVSLSSKYILYVLPDERYYALQAQAISLWWQGFDVDSQLYALTGLVNKGIPVWDMETGHSYTSVIGSRNFLYQFYCAVFYYLAEDVDNLPKLLSFSQAIFVALTLACCYNIALNIFKKQSVALVTCLLIMLDAGVILSSGFTMKEAMAMGLFFFPLLIITELQDGIKYWIFILFIFMSLIMLFLLRFHFALIISTIFFFSILMRPGKKLKQISISIIIIIFSMMSSTYITESFPLITKSYESQSSAYTSIRFIKDNISGTLAFFSYLMKKDDTESSTGGSFSESIFGGNDKNKPNERSVDKKYKNQYELLMNRNKEEDQYNKNIQVHHKSLDPAISNWHVLLEYSITGSIFLAMWKTLFTPFPGNILSIGFTFSYQELSYMFSIMIILFLPYLVVGITRSINYLYGRLMLFCVFIFIGIYIIYFGECSFRQRIAVEPLFLMFIAHGRDVIWNYKAT